MDNENLLEAISGRREKMKQLRDYQHEAIYAGNGVAERPGIIKSLEQHKSTCLVMATGTGKTVVLARVCSEWKRGNVLCLAHRIELVDQMADQLAAELGYRPPVEQGTRGIDPSLFWQGGAVIVGSIQSMITRRRMEKFKDHPFGLIVVDECHRATSPSYVKLLDYCRDVDPECRILGVTATPNRTDGTALGIIFDSVAYELGIVDGIDRGWLVDIRQKFACLGEVDFSKLRCKRNDFGEMDFNHQELEQVMMEEKTLHEMTHPLLDITNDGTQAIVFCASVAHAHLWKSILNRPEYRPDSAASVDGETPFEERRHIVEGFKAGKIQFLLNYGVFTEGFDAPNTGLIVMGRPTKSVLTYMQMLGRGTRPLPGVVDGHETAEGRKDAIEASQKKFLTVLDYVGNSKHQIVSATDVLGGNYDVDVRDAADDLVGATQTGNVRDALRKAKASMILEAEERKRSGITFESPGYVLQDVETFGANGVGINPGKKRGGSTDGQIGFLVNLGMARESAASLTKRQAIGVIGKLRQERCTVKQGKLLQKHGYNPKEFNVDSASAKINEILQKV